MAWCASLAGVGVLSSAVKFDAASFEHILSRRTKTALVFDQTALAERTMVNRARILTALAKEVDAQLHPGAEFAAAASLREAFEWRRDDVRVACKTAQIQWNTAKRFWQGDSNAYGARWGLRFRRVQLARSGAERRFDELLLAAYTPRGVYIYRHDQESGVSTAGKETSATGHDIVYTGPRNEGSWEAVLDGTLLPRLDAEDSGCERLAFVSFDDERMARVIAAHPPSITERTYEGVALSDCSGAARGNLLTAIAREVDQRLHPAAAVEDPLPGIRMDGKLRGAHQAVYSWRRDDTRIACKGAQLKWDRSSRCWEARFSNVKLGYAGSRPASGEVLARPREFDELLLALYTPRAIYVYKHDLLLGVTRAGKRTASSGHHIKLRGPLGEEEWSSALDGTLLPMLDESGCEPVAVIEW